MRKGGILFAALISRFASLMDGHFRGFLDDPAFSVIVEQDLTDGQHRNPTDKTEYFTSSFFHLPEEIKFEVKKSGLVFERLLPVESFGAFIPHFEEFWRDTKRRQRLLGFIRKIENESSLLGVSPHLISIARKP
jgi:hypothetical protein